MNRVHIFSEYLSVMLQIGLQIRLQLDCIARDHIGFAIEAFSITDDAVHVGFHFRCRLVLVSSNFLANVLEANRIQSMRLELVFVAEHIGDWVLKQPCRAVLPHFHELFLQPHRQADPRHPIVDGERALARLGFAFTGPTTTSKATSGQIIHVTSAMSTTTATGTTSSAAARTLERIVLLLRSFSPFLLLIFVHRALEMRHFQRHVMNRRWRSYQLIHVLFLVTLSCTTSATAAAS
mmetsp:Transcript_904/g.1401  ORF Transcript_904/g.1401 Transcript_904/m.1401 type:complete len:236 (+) Transcript_904:342-1049(+)